MRALYDLPAPAKLNLFLHIVGRRDDGYHLLQSVFALIDWCDVLHIEKRSDGRLQRHDLGSALPPEDLCLRAARALQQASGGTEGADIHIDKQVPWGAGLGGGSSDAATTLLALNRLWGLNWPRSRLQQIALPLGADVPFFIGGHNAFVEGIGEQLTPIDLPPLWWAVLKPALTIPTGAIFTNPLVAQRVAQRTASRAAPHAARNTAPNTAPNTADHAAPPDAARAAQHLTEPEAQSASFATETNAAIVASFLAAAGSGGCEDQGSPGTSASAACAAKGSTTEPAGASGAARGGLLGTNDLQDAALAFSQQASAALNELGLALNLLRDRYGSSRMSGSGSAVFAPAGSASQPVLALAPIFSPDELPPGWCARLCKGLSRHPLSDWAAD